MKHWMFVGLAALALSGCSTAPVSEQSAKPIPAERVYAPDLLRRSSTGGAEVVFLRDTGLFGSGCSHDLYVNNRKAFSIRQGEGITLSLPAGAYFFRLETGGGLCPNVATSQDASVKPGAKLGYRILLPSDGSLRLTRIR